MGAAERAEQYILLQSAEHHTQRTVAVDTEPSLLLGRRKGCRASAAQLVRNSRLRPDFVAAARIHPRTRNSAVHLHHTRPPQGVGVEMSWGSDPSQRRDFLLQLDCLCIQDNPT